MAEHTYHEKDEKDEEKREEKSPEEKSWEEKWRRDPLNAATWAMIFIWAGLVFLAENLQLFSRWISRQIVIPGLGVAQVETWSLILIGAGVIVLVEVAIRLLVPAYRRAISGSLIFAVILLGVGLGSIFGWDIVWPLILIGIGLSVLFRGFLRRA